MSKRFDDVIFVKDADHEMPEPGKHCYVAGGIAVWDGECWLSLMDKPHRQIAWDVHWWAYVVYGDIRPNDPPAVSIESFLK